MSGRSVFHTELPSHGPVHCVGRAARTAIVPGGPCSARRCGRRVHAVGSRRPEQESRRPLRSIQGRSWAVAASISFMVMFSLPLRIAMTAAVETT